MGQQRPCVEFYELFTEFADFQVGQVKEKIAAEKGWEASQQKLIYSGGSSYMM